MDDRKSGVQLEPCDTTGAISGTRHKPSLGHGTSHLLDKAQAVSWTRHDRLGLNYGMSQAWAYQDKTYTPQLTLYTLQLTLYTLQAVSVYNK